MSSTRWITSTTGWLRGLSVLFVGLFRSPPLVRPPRTRVRVVSTTSSPSRILLQSSPRISPSRIPVRMPMMTTPPSGCAHAASSRRRA
jgi:hypothetical protein